MSRMGRKPIPLSGGVKASMDGNVVTLTGPKGTLSFTVPEPIAVSQQGTNLVVSRGSDDRQAKANHGMVRSILNGMVEGVSTGFRKSLEFQGVGYRGQLEGRRLSLSVGLSEAVKYDIPDGVVVTMPDPTHIVIEGCVKQLVGQVAASLRAFRPPDAYQGKGIRYVGERVVLKEGKTVG